jgi:hypothetical protein
MSKYSDISKSPLSSILEFSIEIKFSVYIFEEPQFNASLINGGASLGPF